MTGWQLGYFQALVNYMHCCNNEFFFEIEIKIELNVRSNGVSDYIS